MPAMKTSLVSLVGLIAFSCMASAQTDRSRSTKIKPTAERSSGISAPEPWRRPGHGKPNARLRAQSAVAAGMNANTVTVVAGTPGGTYYRAASDLAFVLDDERLRVLAVLGKGAGQNVYDIRFLRGVDSVSFAWTPWSNCEQTNASSIRNATSPMWQDCSMMRCM